MPYNKTILMGNLTRALEVKAVGTTCVGDFTIAVNRKFKKQSGEQVEEVSFIDCKAWGKTAEIMAQYLDKGSSVLVDGRLQQESWEKDGQKRSKLVLVVENFSFTGGPAGDNDGSPKHEYKREQAAPKAEIDPADIPF
jgi:single-strand DNA-binding protein